MSLDWLYTAISFVLKLWHSLFTSLGLDPQAGITWALSIFFLVVTVRILLFRFFIKQVQSQRAMQALQPDIAKLKKTHGADRQGMAKAQQDLFKEKGVNPLAGCLPIILQAPVFLSLFHVLRRLRPGAQGLYSWDDLLTDSAARASLFGAPISSSFNMDPEKAAAIFAIDGVSYTTIRIVAFTLMVAMSITTFITQKQIMRKGGPVEGQAAMIQKFMLYVIPVSLFVSGFFFPIGVLLYWFMNNLWTMGQQFYILHKHPAIPTKVGADADRPVVDGKTLAPKPGARRDNPKTTRPAAPGSTAGTEPTPKSGSPKSGSPKSGSPKSGSSAKPGTSTTSGSTPKSGSPSGNGVSPPRPGAAEPVSLNKPSAAGARPPGTAKRPSANRPKRKKR